MLPIFICPPMAILMAYTGTALHGSFGDLFQFLRAEGIFSGIAMIWFPVFFGTKAAWMIIGIFAVIQLAFIKLLPGSRYEGPETIEGYTPVYKQNGRAAFFLTILFFCIASFGLHWFSPAIIYDHFFEIVGALNFTSLAFCLLLYFKGRFAPEPTDAITTGNFFNDYFWGIELYPKIGGWDVKHFTNSRFGMMAWPVIIISFAAKQHQLYGLTNGMIVSVILQLWYVSQFFWWETGYFRTMDIQHDRAGFYLCWGTLVWVPTVYPSAALYLVHHPISLGWTLTGFILFVGMSSILAKNLSNRQRLHVRETGGNTLVWGKPARIIRAKYININGEEKENILLASGYWGIARHFHYTGEILGAFCWSVPALFHSFYPYFYVTYLTILLINRVNRDDKKCTLKYGSYWTAYKKLVPYKIFPGVY
ncbi:MAG: hypothetical protein JWN78_2722 [Bacteroidota bacterium]|nr:hypothetical protein [Bacteroidota bacterium]